MDTVSMLNKMSFYCQPILPLVYDESMSYYETLCKVVGQLNTTGETVNKLNEGLTNEISDRQAADALLDERLKVLESTNKKIHFLVFAGTPPHGAGLIGTVPTRSELRQWVNNNDLIITLLETTNGERNVVYAASCTYNAENWTDESSDGFNIIVPISTSYDSEGVYAVRQKIAKITIPPASASSLDEKWGLQVIEINTPSTSANGVVNFAANIFDDGHMECNLTPFEFMNLYAPTWANRILCVAVNAKLIYDGYTRTSSIATLNSTNRLIRIAFERDYGTFINNGVKQLNKTLDYIIGDVSHNTWTHESIDSKVFDFSRYEGFQFTRGAGNVITTDDESTPNAVYIQYYSNSSGKLYQNLPVRLIDTVDGAEYWNGTFDIYDGKHMTFTFVTSNYDTASNKMLVRVIELSADVNATAWKYGVKEFSLPLTGPSASDFMITATLASGGAATLDKTFAQIRDAITDGRAVVMQIVDPEGPTIYASLVRDTPTNLMFSAAGRSGFYSVLNVVSVNSDNSCTVSHETMPVLNSNLALPQLSMASAPTEGMEIATKKYVDGHISKDAVLYTAQTLTLEQKRQARKNIEALPVAAPATGGAVSLCPSVDNVDSNDAVHIVPYKANDEDYTLALSCGPENWPVRVKGIRTPTDVDTYAAANVEYVKAKVAGAAGATVDTEMSDTSTNAVQNKVIKKYVDDHAGGTAARVALSGTVEGEVSGYTSATYQQIVDEIAKTGNIWLTVSGETVRLASWKQAGSDTYALTFFGVGAAAEPVKYVVTASASAATLTVTGS